MNKKIEDYLHLYIGCEFLADGNRDTLAGVHYHANGIFALLGRETESTTPEGWWVDNCDFKLLLRPLSSMTEEEKVRLALWEFPNIKEAEISKNDSDNASICFRSETGMKCYLNFHHISPESTRKLLKAGLDLFGLIESGLAIDKTKSK